MKRYIKYIFLSLLTCFLASSCIEEIAAPQPETGSELATLVPRVKSFTNQYVTKATDPYTQNEKKIEKLTVLIFSGAADEQENHRLIYTQQANGSSLTLNKSELNTLASSAELTSATVVMFANVSLADIMKKNSDGTYTAIGNSLTLEELNDCSIHMGNSPVVLSSELESFGGFPMKGVATANLTIGSTTPIVVNLQILYAKVNFEINVAAGTENQALTQPSFTLQKFSVHNVAKRTSVELADGVATASTDHVTTGKEEICSNNTFTFYIPESRYNPKANENGKIDLNGIYPTGWTTSVAAEDVKGYTDALADQLNGVKYFYDDLVQQYKPKLAEGIAGTPSNTKEGLATYVIVKGTYVDYRNTTWDVNYKIYLGKDNAQNFHVDRNSEYTNILTIKGIRNNDSYGDGNVWIDHRVDVSYAGDGADDCVTITRETLIDSHIEVRPLRVNWEEGKYTFARVFLPYYTQDGGKTWAQRDEVTAQMKNWIGIELGDKTGSLYCSGDNNPSKGKRKYFTETLVSDLNKASENTDIISEEGQDKFIALANDQCAWVYIDEYWNDTSTATNPATQDRTAKIVVEFCTIADNKISVKNREEYILLQQPLIDIDGKYYIENYEEYLHSYNSHDKYNILTSPTDYSGQGLQWGFTQTGANRVSKSQFVTKMPMSQWTDWTPDNSEAYDFIHAKDVEANQTLGGYKIVDKDGNDIDLTRNTGYNFTYTASANNGITISSMDKMPESAYQYCLSKNKFKEGTDGQDNEMLIRWYVPDVYELSEIFLSEESPLSNESYYWSSQAPYVTGQSSFFSADIASEVVDQARLVSKEDGIGSKPRTEKHRIRCLYNRNGETANMENRTPEGIGGLIKIPMTVKDNGYFDYSPWFTNLGKVNVEYPDPLPSYRFPKGDTYAVGNKDRDDADDYFGGVLINEVHYYSKNPLDSQNWGPLGSGDNTTYDAMNPSKWPGLSNKESKLWQGSETINRYQLSDKDKQITRTYTSRSGSKIDAMPENLNDVFLDHNKESKNNLTISFDKGANSSNSPKYEYYNEDGSAAVQQTWAKYWNVPEYSSKDFPSTDKKTFPAPEREVSYTDSEVKNKIDDEFNSLVGALFDDEQFTYLSHTATPITTRSIYSYASASDARNAATTYFNEEINANGEYKAISNSDISTPSQSVELCSYTYTYKKEIRYWERPWYNPIIGQWGSWNDNGTGTGSGILTKTLYTYVITYQKKDGTYYRYVAGTGGWGEETPLSEKPVSIDPEKPNVDALTFYAGNTFTISCTKSNYYIRSIKVNYNTNIIESGKTYLRFMDNSKNLPAENKDPEQMTYLDGGSGWSKWTSVGDNSSVSLRLVICDMNTNSWWIGNWGDPKMTHKNPSTSTQRGYSLIINSLEIRLEEKKDTKE